MTTGISSTKSNVYYSIQPSPSIAPKKAESLPEETIPNSDFSSVIAKQNEMLRKAHEDKYPKSLSTILHEGIQPAHQIAVGNAFLRSLINKEDSFCAKAYTAYLCNLFTIHEALEKAQKEMTDKYGEGFFVFPLLFRSEYLLKDIQMWSIFSTFSDKFAQRKPQSEDFKLEVKAITEEITHQFLSHIEETAQSSENCWKLVGTLYAFYGTVMSGGQLVKLGVKHGFIERLKDPENIEGSSLKTEILNTLAQDPNFYQIYAEKSVSFFTFSDPDLKQDLCIPQFKLQWHKHLDELLPRLKSQARDPSFCEKELIEEAKYSIQTVLEMIDRMIKNIDHH